MKHAVRALRPLALISASLLMASCAVSPGPYYRSGTINGGYYDGRALPRAGYYSSPGPRPYGLFGPGYGGAGIGYHSRVAPVPHRATGHHVATKGKAGHSAQPPKGSPSRSNASKSKGGSSRPSPSSASKKPGAAGKKGKK